MILCRLAHYRTSPREKLGISIGISEGIWPGFLCPPHDIPLGNFGEQLWKKYRHSNHCDNDYGCTGQSFASSIQVVKVHTKIGDFF